MLKLFDYLHRNLYFCSEFKHTIQTQKTKLAGLLEMVGVDKALHFLVGMIFVLAGLVYGLGFSTSPAGWGGWAAFIIVAISFAKEKFIDKSFDFADVMATFFGAALGMLLYIPVDAF